MLGKEKETQNLTFDFHGELMPLLRDKHKQGNKAKAMS